MRTTDGGVTWSALAMVKGVDIGHAAFSSATTGWAAGDGWLWGTTDGGATWHKVRRAPGYDQLTVTGDGIWAIPTLGPAPGALSNYALRSTDGGVTWRRASDMVGSSVAFADAQDGWVVKPDGWSNAYPHHRRWRGLDIGHQRSEDGCDQSVGDT